MGSEAKCCLLFSSQSNLPRRKFHDYSISLFPNWVRTHAYSFTFLAGGGLLNGQKLRATAEGVSRSMINVQSVISSRIFKYRSWPIVIALPNELRQVIDDVTRRVSRAVYQANHANLSQIDTGLHACSTLLSARSSKTWYALESTMCLLLSRVSCVSLQHDTAQLRPGLA